MLCLGFAVYADGEAELAAEVADKGWIAYGARSENESWDLFLSRPDGSDRRNITNTPDFEEGAPRFFLDGSRMLYRRMPRGAVINHDGWGGFQGQLVIANADGSEPVVRGEEGDFPWATLAPEGNKVACLTLEGIQVIDLDTQQVLRELPRNGIHQQMFWSPDGKWFCGVANHHGASWTVVRMHAETGEMNPVRSFQNCTPDWLPDSKRIILSSRPDGQPGGDGYGYTQLWVVDGEGGNDKLIYGEDGRHIYGGRTSPDGKYVLFTRGEEDGNGSEKSGAPICVMRMSDAPIIAGESVALRTLHPDTKDGPVLEIGRGWEPDWTYTEVSE